MSKCTGHVRSMGTKYTVRIILYDLQKTGLGVKLSIKGLLHHTQYIKKYPSISISN